MVPPWIKLPDPNSWWELLHKAGHTLGYKDILQLDTALAESTLESMDEESGTAVPSNLVTGRFVHFSTDNIDINDSALDGKHTSHATQAAAWQCGPEPDDQLSMIKPSTRETLSIPEAMNIIVPAHIDDGTAEPPRVNIKPEWFTKQECEPALKAQAQDFAFILKPHGQNPKSTWTGFNQEYSTKSPPKTTVGYMPIIQAPAHDVATLNTVVQRILRIAASTEQQHGVLTVDEALFPKLMELKWTIPE